MLRIKSAEDFGLGFNCMTRLYMAKSGYSRRGLFGTMTHYDGSGKKVGESRPGMFGGYSNYDANGHKVGHSSRGFLGGINHYDNSGHKIGESNPGLFGSMSHYDSNHKKQHIVVEDFWVIGITMIISEEA